MKVKNFSYNGFMGKLLDGHASYEAKFKSWTNDPGVMVCSCSDGKDRLIPTFALEKDPSEYIPKQKYTGKGKVMFGSPSHS